MAARAVASTPWRASSAQGVPRSGRSALTPRRRPAAASSSSSSSSSSSLHQLARGAGSQPAVPRLALHVAASFIAKDRPYDPSTHVFHFNPYNRIQPPRRSRRAARPDSGHDAFFVSRVNDSGAVALGVADGVGGWTASGIDPGDFSHTFCDYMAAVAYEHDPAAAAAAAAAPPPLTARRLMQRGYDAVCGDRSLYAGGSTACVAIAAPDGTLDVANLGDSGFLHLRLNAVNAYSVPQTHAFNTPFQLSLIPPRLAARMAAFGGAHLCDLPQDADGSQHRLRHGDVLLFATDGVFDNLFNQDILRIASRVMVSSGAWTMNHAGGVCVADAPDTLDNLVRSLPPAADGRIAEKTATLQSLLATEIVAAAKSASINTKVDGPFAKDVHKYYPHEQWRGGKVDDICVVVAIVSEEPSGSSSKL